MPPSAATAAGSAPSDSGPAAARLRRPVSSEATAAITFAAIANANATPRPSWNGLVIRCGKNWRPVT